TTTPCQTADRWSTNNQCWDIDTGVWGNPATYGYCCGDDANEYYTDTAGNTACCATEGAEVNASGECTGGVGCEPIGQTNYYKITNSVGETVAQFGDKGYLEIAGDYDDLSTVSDPGGNIFMIKNSSDQLVFYIDKNGDLVAKGVVAIEVPIASLNGHIVTYNDFAIQNSTNDHVALVDENGNLLLAECIKTGVIF
ncbi:hypothetical protein KKI23_01375, partial [Patescibacteria group bacterium]|nr:hypothetical protein [Patescibacteria group bacterium]